MRDNEPTWVTEREGKKQEGPRYCQVEGCGGVLMDHGFCMTGYGYPEGYAFRFQNKWHPGPPELCEVNQCGGALEWDGKCYRCWNNGQRTIIPGHLYELRSGHWLKIGPARRPISDCGVPGCTMTLEQHRTEGLKAIREMIAAVTA